MDSSSLFDEITWFTGSIVLGYFFQSLKSNKFRKKKMIPFKKDFLKDTYVLDCSHPSAKQLTHHLKPEKQKQLMDLQFRGDSSTDAVLSALKAGDDGLFNCSQVTTNHFDIDSFLSIWSAINGNEALMYERLLREAAKIGDFRELTLLDATQDNALRIVCWINSVEEKLFYRPFDATISSMEGEVDSSEKFAYFLPRFNEVLRNPRDEKWFVDYAKDYKRVIAEYNTLHSLFSSTFTNSYARLGLIIIETPDPVHYYSLFSLTKSFDIVLSCYSQNRYELEVKYTTYVDINSRPCLPRVEMNTLVKFLNKKEQENSSSDLFWCCESVVDSGPLLRLEDPKREKLSKAQRYANPFERNILSSTIGVEELKATVVSYISFAYETTGVKAKKDWTWSEIHEFNKSIQWTGWSPQKKL